MPKILVHLALLLTLPTMLPAQTLEQGVGLEISPHFGNRRLTGGQGIPFQQVERRDSLESGVGGYSVGLVYDSRNGRIGFTTGVRYLTTGYNVDRQFVGQPGSARSFLQEVRASYLSIPFELNFWQDINDDDRVLFVLGLAANLHLNTTTTQINFLNEDETGREEIPEDPDLTYRNPVISLNTGFGYDRKLGQNWSLRLQPMFTFFLQGNLQAEAERNNRNYFQLSARATVRRIF